MLVEDLKVNVQFQCFDFHDVQKTGLRDFINISRTR